MLPTASIISLNASKGSVQLVENTTDFSGGLQLTGSFAEILQTPADVSSSGYFGDPGEVLPPPGKELPQGSLSDLLPAEISVPGLVDDNPDAQTPSVHEVIPTTHDESALWVNGSIMDRSPARSGEFVSPLGSSNTTPVKTVSPEFAATNAGNQDLSNTDRQNDSQRIQLIESVDASAKLSPKTGADSTAGVYQESVATSAQSVVPDSVDGNRNSLIKAASTIHIASGAIDSSHLPHTHSPAAKPIPAVATTISLPITDNAWGDALNDRVLWMTNRNVQNADIRLNPSELGPIRVQVSVDNDAAQLVFNAQHPLTREAIEQAMPRLREMLSENGLSLAGSTVSDGGDSDSSDSGVDQNRESSPGQDSLLAEGDTPGESGFVESPVHASSTLQLVDTFA